MHAFSWTPDDMVFEAEYNVAGRRLFPWPGVPEPFWGGAWVSVPEGETSTSHNHDENEMFFIFEGTGVMRIGDEERRVSKGDTIFITPFKDHTLTNDTDKPLIFLTIWWGGAEAEAKRAAAEEASA
ncbi:MULTISPECIES: cupin domain-containing protein [unclassified Streptomyces]|uniref:cupin domain-containing protein n=1 Tax=unclassified Streptomyces TaxID=2593676 RepID=UPI00093F67E1|nr:MULTISPECIES: cupin domain-containing protein [unclassified Streptomyces]OKK03482.1 hypothetical protein AMK26_18500 [Streptomyces sp. CB03234]ORT60680.1 hypothetical protein BKD26_05445 [Streptomyces sp. CB03238]